MCAVCFSPNTHKISSSVISIGLGCCSKIFIIIIIIGGGEEKHARPIGTYLESIPHPPPLRVMASCNHTRLLPFVLCLPGMPLVAGSRSPYFLPLLPLPLSRFVFLAIKPYVVLWCAELCGGGCDAATPCHEVACVCACMCMCVHFGSEENEKEKKKPVNRSVECSALWGRKEVLCYTRMIYIHMFALGTG